MERLTQTSNKGGVAFTFDLDITCRQSEAEKILKLAEKLKAYEDAYEQGRLLVLPCKVGDYAWDLISHHRFEVVSIEFHMNGLVMFRCGNKGTYDYALFALEDIGDTWMLSEPKETDLWSSKKVNTEKSLANMKGEEHG